MARNVPIRSDEELDMARRAARLAAEVLNMVEPHVVPGVSTEALDQICHDHIVNVETSHEALLAGIQQVRPGATLGDVGHAIQTVAQREHFGVVREYCGHGIGQIYHDAPQVLHYGRRGEGLRLEAGMVFTIEPMLNAGQRDTRQLSDGWTVVTKDRSLSAQWEHMVAVTPQGHEVLTAWPGSTGGDARV